jgi:hypothetical protein
MNAFAQEACSKQKSNQEGITEQRDENGDLEWKTATEDAHVFVFCFFYNHREGSLRQEVPQTHRCYLHALLQEQDGKPVPAKHP